MRLADTLTSGAARPSGRIIVFVVRVECRSGRTRQLQGRASITSCITLRTAELVQDVSSERTSACTFSRLQSRRSTEIRGT